MRVQEVLSAWANRKEVSWEDVDKVITSYKKLRKDNKYLKEEAELRDAFYQLTIKERNFERIKNDKLYSLLTKLEWFPLYYPNGESQATCKICHATREDGGHASDCELGKALK